MLVATEATRTFTLKENGQDVVLTDPNPSFSPEAVLNFYANTYPALTTAKIQGPDWNNDKLEYKFTTTLGTKG
ncbi:PRTRC system protein C [Spirosoma fluviale]|uniref:PRTRC system protein C n=1 Tax=Spirosoma fluviale TaxID=1597977 RepID=A0A286FCM6_9BACT|nr:PRTRC system protein C [Spirosoma fluviale]SOD80846.1 PRTRC system protein C [Spirosoma fluviale]